MIYFNYMVKYVRQIIVAGTLCFITSPVLFAQDDIGKEVFVIRTFEPSVADASKINLLPSITDTISVSPDFSYNILPVPISMDFEVEPITPARMSAETVSKLYGSYIKLGLGSYTSPMGELSINNLRHNEYSGGIFLKHHSSHGEIKLDNSRTAFSQFSDNTMNFYGKRMGRNNVLSGKMGLQSNGFHYYGYDTSIDTIPAKDDIEQRFMHANAGFQFKSSHPDSIHMNYDLNLNYDYFQDRRDVGEHGLTFRSSFSKFIRTQVVGAHFDVDYYDNTLIADTSNLVLKLSPWFNKADEEWEVFAGFHAYYDQFGSESKVYFHPRASLQFSIIQDYVIPYVGIDGRLNVNNYRTVALDNNFIVPGLMVENSNRSMDFYSGIKGNFTRDISFNFKVSYAVIDGMHFYVTDSSPGSIGNQFSVVYDDVELLNYSGEVGADISNRFNLLARVNYYDYSMQLQEHPWHKPALDMRFSANYNLGDKILLNADVFHKGSRYARSINEGAEPYELEGITDFNLGIEYRYSKILSGFLRLNNISNARYYKWNNYPQQGFSVMAGFTYSL